MGNLDSVVLFRLERRRKVSGETFDPYEEIKEGTITSEWRDATPYWKRRLTVDGKLKVNRAWFTVGYPKNNLPRLEADITKLVYSLDGKFEIQISNVVEVM